jgi:RNA polymerase sigma-70 factor, ECF subfamily
MTQVNTQTIMVPLSADIIKRAQAGDSDAFADLFNAHKSRIYALCLRMTNNTAEAEDLTQDAFMQVFRKLSTFRGDSALSTWLHRTDGEGKTVRRECGGRDSRLSGTVDRIALTRALKELPAGYRTIFLLHEVQGYEHQEIAQLLDCSVGNSKSQLHKAKLRIREILARTTEAAELVRTRNSDTQKEPLPLLDDWDVASDALEDDLPISHGQFTPPAPQLIGAAA